MLTLMSALSCIWWRDRRLMRPAMTRSRMMNGGSTSRAKPVIAGLSMNIGTRVATRVKMSDRTEAAVLDGVLGVEHVAGEPGHQRSGLGAGEEGHRHALDVVVQLRSEIEDDALPDHRAEPPAHERQGGGGQGQTNHGRRQHVDHVQVVALDALVDQAFHQEGRDGTDHCPGQYHQQVEEQPPAIGPQEAPDAPVGAFRDVGRFQLGRVAARAASVSAHRRLLDVLTHVHLQAW